MQIMHVIIYTTPVKSHLRLALHIYSVSRIPFPKKQNSFKNKKLVPSGYRNTHIFYFGLWSSTILSPGQTDFEEPVEGYREGYHCTFV